MAYTFSNLVRDAATKMGRGSHFTFVATGGSTTTAVCTTLSDKYEDDTPVNGSLIVVRDSAGAGAAPEGEFGVISAYSQSANTFTVPTLTAAIASGDSVMYIKAKFPLESFRTVANNVLRGIGKLRLEDTSTTTVATDREYDLPVGLKYGPIEIWYQGSTTDSDVNDWELISPGDYVIFPAAAGTAGRIQFASSFPSGHTLKIIYQDFHPRVWDYDDVIHETVAPEWASSALALGMLKWYGGRGNDTLVSRLTVDAQRADNQFDSRPAQTDGRILSYRRTKEVDLPPTPIYTG